MTRKCSGLNLFCAAFLLGSVLIPSHARGQAANTLIGAVFGLTYLQAYDTKEIDFYYGQTFYNNDPKHFSYFDTYSTTFGTDITLYNHDAFNWFMGTERLGRTGNGTLSGTSPSQSNLQWNIPVVGLYTGVRYDFVRLPLQPYLFAIGGVYSLSDLLGGDAVLLNGTYTRPGQAASVTYTGSTYNVTGTTLGYELGIGITPLTLWNDSLEISVEGNYRSVNFPNAYYGPTSSSLPALPLGLPPSIDYSGWSIQLALTFEPSKNANKKEEGGPAKTDEAREKLLSGNIPFKSAAFLDAVNNCDPYLVDLFLKAGFKPGKDLLDHLSNDKEKTYCYEIKKIFFLKFAKEASKKELENKGKPGEEASNNEPLSYVKAFLDSGFILEKDDYQALKSDATTGPGVLELIKLDWKQTNY